MILLCKLLGDDIPDLGLNLLSRKVLEGGQGAGLQLDVERSPA